MPVLVILPAARRAPSQRAAPGDVDGPKPGADKASRRVGGMLAAPAGRTLHEWRRPAMPRLTGFGGRVIASCSS